MSGYLIFTMPNITVREDDTDLLTVTIDLLTSTPADAYEAAADVIRRIQSDREADTIAAADRDAIAAAEKRGAALEREAVVEWLLTAKVTSDAPYISKCIERGDHLDGESDDS